MQEAQQKSFITLKPQSKSGFHQIFQKKTRSNHSDASQDPSIITGNNQRPRKLTGGLTKDSDDDTNNTNSKIETVSPYRSKGDLSGFNSHALINAKLEKIQSKNGSAENLLQIKEPPINEKIFSHHHDHFDTIVESKDPKHDMTMSKIDSGDLQASEINKLQCSNIDDVTENT